MEQVDKAAMRAALQAANPRRAPADVAIYVDAVADYRVAQANIDEHGSIVFHPRTGAPIENPYLAVRAKAAAVILKAKLKGGDVWG